MGRLLTPAFRRQQFFVNLCRATDALMRTTEGEFSAADVPAPASGDGVPTAVLFTVLILIAFVVRAVVHGGGNGHGRARARRDSSGMPVIIWGAAGSWWDSRRKPDAPGAPFVLCCRYPSPHPPAP